MTDIEYFGRHALVGVLLGATLGLYFSFLSWILTP